MTDEWVYHLQDARTDAWLSRNLPLRDVEINDVLTGHSSMRATIAPETATALGPAGLEEWGVWIYAEKGGFIRFGGLLAGAQITDDGNALELDVQGLTAYAEGQPYTEKFRLWNADPLDCFREIWRFLLSFPRSPLHVVVDGDQSSVRISDVQPPAKPKRANVTYPNGSPYGTAGDHWPRPARPVRLRRKRPKKRARRQNESAAHWATYEASFARDLGAWTSRRNATYTSRFPKWRAWHKRLAAMRSNWEDDYGDREPYKLSWWEETDCGQELQRLAEEGNFEWRERHTWSDGAKSNVNHRIQLGLPATFGTVHATPLTLADLAAPVPVVVRGGDGYANVVFGLGAGEGRKMVRYAVYADDSRLRRAVSVANKKIKRRTRLAAFARDQLSWRRLLRDTPEICLWDTDGNLGIYRLGDTITLQLTEGWHSGTTSHRIVGRRYRPDDDDQIYLQLVRAERGAA